MKFTSEHDADTAPKPDDDTGNPNAEAARYRTRLRETETERDTLAGRLAGMQRAEAERIAGAGLSRASDLWIDGRDVAELLDDDGNIDPEKVTAEVTSVLDGRPGLAVPARPRPRPDPSQGRDQSMPSDTAWSDVLRGGRR